jgi:hypothetical protein
MWEIQLRYTIETVYSLHHNWILGNSHDFMDIHALFWNCTVVLCHVFFTSRMSNNPTIVECALSSYHVATVLGQRYRGKLRTAWTIDL